MRAMHISLDSGNHQAKLLSVQTPTTTASTPRPATPKPPTPKVLKQLLLLSLV